MSNPFVPQKSTIKQQLLNQYSNICMLIGQKTHDAANLQAEIEGMLKSASDLKGRYLAAEAQEKESAAMKAAEDKHAKDSANATTEQGPVSN